MRQASQVLAPVAVLACALAVASAGAGRPASTAAPATSTAYCSGVDVAALRKPYAFRYGLSGEELQAAFFNQGGLASDGYRPLRLTGYRAGSTQLFATKWTRAAGPAWNAKFGLTGAAFSALYSQLRATHRPADVSGYSTPGGATRFAAIWERNTPRVDWRLHRDVSRARMDELVDGYAKSGFVPVRVEAYTSGGQLRYVSVWVKTACAWRMHNRMTRAEYGSKLEGYKGFRLVHLDAFVDGGNVYYAGIWWKQPGPGQEVRSDRDWYVFQRFGNSNTCEGRVIDDFYATDVPGAVRYGGIWTATGAPTFPAGSSLESRVAQEVNCAPARSGAAVINVTSGQQILVHADVEYGTASMIKSAILYAVLRKIDATADTLDTQIPAGPEVYGSNQGGTLTARRSYPLRTFATTMIANSNNWASNRLIDYAGGFRAINSQLDALGVGDVNLRRYFKGGSAPSVSGNSSPNGDYAEGIDNSATPRAYAELLRLVHENKGLLSRTSWPFFWSMLALNSGAHDTVLDAGVATNRASIVSVFEKAGSNTWTSTPATKPQVPSRHLQRSAGGRLVFGNGQVVVYAMYFDEATSRTQTPLANAAGCVIMHVVRQYSGTTTGADVPACRAG